MRLRAARDDELEVELFREVEGGLAPMDAVRALTIRPAEILGVAQQLGTIEVGKIANLTVTRGDLFSKTGASRTS